MTSSAGCSSRVRASCPGTEQAQRQPSRWPSGVVGSAGVGSVLGGRRRAVRRRRFRRTPVAAMPSPTEGAREATRAGAGAPSGGPYGVALYPINDSACANPGRAPLADSLGGPVPGPFRPRGLRVFTSAPADVFWCTSPASAGGPARRGLGLCGVRPGTHRSVPGDDRPRVRPFLLSSRPFESTGGGQGMPSRMRSRPATGAR